MESILSLIQKYKSGDFGAKAEILERMTPLVKKYASKIHCMEYEDALQELYIALLETLPYLDITQSEWKCLKYMETAVVNRYYSLCKHYLSVPKTEDIETCSATLEAPPAFDDTYYDIVNYINSFPAHSVKREILSLYFYKDKSDTEIANKLGLSRQYINRIKKTISYGLFKAKIKAMIPRLNITAGYHYLYIIRLGQIPHPKFRS